MSTQDEHLDFEDEIKSENPRRQLVALRGLLAKELNGERCKSCKMIERRSGDIAALALRLQKVLEDIQALPPENKEGTVSRLESIRGRRTDRPPAPPDSGVASMGYKSSPRRQGGRAPSGTRKPGA